MARFMPLAPVGGTMCAASPARSSRPCCIGVGDEAAHRGDALVEQRSFGEREAVVGGQARRQLGPDAVVGPVVEALVGRHLQVHPGDRRRAHRVQREAVLVPAVDQLVRRRRRFGEDPQPGERVVALEHLEPGHLAAADAVEAVGADDEVGVELDRSLAAR